MSCLQAIMVLVTVFHSQHTHSKVPVACIKLYLWILTFLVLRRRAVVNTYLANWLDFVINCTSNNVSQFSTIGYILHANRGSRQSMDCPAQTVDSRFARTIHELPQALHVHDQLNTSTLNPTNYVGFLILNTNPNIAFRGRSQSLTGIVSFPLSLFRLTLSGSTRFAHDIHGYTSTKETAFVHCYWGKHMP